MTNSSPLPVGTFVRELGHPVNIRHGAIGRVVRMHEHLTNCPVVTFPNPGDTFGPHCTFVVTDPAGSLEILDPAHVTVTDSGRYVHDDSEPCANCGTDLRDHDREDRRTCEREHALHV